MPRWLITVLLLVGSNIFMTMAWYGHLKYSGQAEGEGDGRLSLLRLAPVILISWLIALPEYMLQVPANRIGHVNFGGTLSAPQLKVIQEAITLAVFSAFSILYLKEKIRPQDGIAFALVFLAVAVSMWGRGAPLAK